MWVHAYYGLHVEVRGHPEMDSLRIFFSFDIGFHVAQTGLELLLIRQSIYQSLSGSLKGSPVRTWAHLEDVAVSGIFTVGRVAAHTFPARCKRIHWRGKQDRYTPASTECRTLQ